MPANATQVGGTHYRTTYQHWDLVADLNLGYFEGQITKYITRHRSKKGLEDVMKAQHFAVKLLELNSARGYPPMHLFPTGNVMFDYRAANGLRDDEMACIMDVVTWRHPHDLHRLLSSIESVLMQYGIQRGGWRDSGKPSAAYVDQG